MDPAGDPTSRDPGVPYPWHTRETAPAKDISGPSLFRPRRGRPERLDTEHRGFPAPVPARSRYGPSPSGGPPSGRRGKLLDPETRHCWDHVALPLRRSSGLAQQVRETYPPVRAPRMTQPNRSTGGNLYRLTEAPFHNSQALSDIPHPGNTGSPDSRTPPKWDSARWLFHTFAWLPRDPPCGKAPPQDCCKLPRYRESARGPCETHRPPPGTERRANRNRRASCIHPSYPAAAQSPS